MAFMRVIRNRMRSQMHEVLMESGIVDSATVFRRVNLCDSSRVLFCLYFYFSFSNRHGKHERACSSNDLH